MVPSTIYEEVRIIIESSAVLEKIPNVFAAIYSYLQRIQCDKSRQILPSFPVLIMYLGWGLLCAVIGCSV